MPSIQLSDAQQDVALQSIGTVLGKTPAEVEALLTAESADTMPKSITDRLKTIRDENEQKGRGVLQRIANKKAKELFGVEFDEDPKSVDDLLDKVKETYQPKVDPTTLTEEQIKKSPTYRDLEKRFETTEATHKTALETANQEKQSEIAYLKLEGRAKEALTKFGAVLAEDPKIEEIRTQLYLDNFKGITEKKEEDGTVTFWKEGKRLDNEKTLFPLKEDELLQSMVGKHYTTQVSDQRQAPGVKPEDKTKPAPANGFKHFTGVMPKNDVELNVILDDKKTYNIDARKEVVDAYRVAQSQS